MADRRGGDAASPTIQAASGARPLARKTLLALLSSAWVLPALVGPAQAFTHVVADKDTLSASDFAGRDTERHRHLPQMRRKEEIPALVLPPLRLRPEGAS